MNFVGFVFGDQNNWFKKTKKQKKQNWVETLVHVVLSLKFNPGMFPPPNPLFRNAKLPAFVYAAIVGFGPTMAE